MCLAADKKMVSLFRKKLRSKLTLILISLIAGCCRRQPDHYF
jgi:hypothetical protein